MKTLKKIIRVIIATIIILIVALNVYNFINIKILNKDLSTIFGYSTLEVVSGSMRPTIEVGELIIIDTNEKNYKKDDIVTFYDVNGAFVTHRIVSIDEDEMITKGDNNDSKDGVINTDKIVGKYVCKIPYLGTVLSIIQKPVILALILVIGILYSYLVSTEETKEKKIEQKTKTHTKKLSNRKQKQLLRKQEKQDFKEFKQWKKEQLKLQEQREFQEFRRMKEEQRQAARQKEIEKIEEILEEEISNEPVISQNTNSVQKRKPRKKHKSHKQQKKNNQKNKKHKSKKNYKYNQTNQRYNRRN